MTGETTEEAKTIEVEGECPLPDTHRRLADSHRLWHQTAEAYDSPDAFRTNLNATIEALRNVTFMLQSEKRNIPDFDPWYEQWQERMRADPIMRWLHDARTHVVKRGDLDTRSIARVSVRASWDEPAVTEFDVPPLTTTEEIANIELEKVTLPQVLKDEGILIVERRWVAETLPDSELLDALAYCYGFLEEVVFDAHERCGVEMKKVTADPEHSDEPDRERLGRPLPCMVAKEADRSVALHVRTGERMDVQERALPSYDPVIGEEAAKRYKISAEPLDYDPFQWGQYCSELARRMLLIDGYHQPVVFLFTPKGLRTIVIPASNQAEKYLLWERVADEVDRTDATGLVMIGETWTGTMEGVARGFRPAEDPGRGEALLVVAAAEDGHCRIWHTPFFRRLGRIFTRRTAVVDNEAPAFLQPVIRVWQRKRA